MNAFVYSVNSRLEVSSRDLLVASDQGSAFRVVDVMPKFSGLGSGTYTQISSISVVVTIRCRNTV